MSCLTPPDPEVYQCTRPWSGRHTDRRASSRWEAEALSCSYECCSRKNVFEAHISFGFMSRLRHTHRQHHHPHSPSVFIPSHIRASRTTTTDTTTSTSHPSSYPLLIFTLNLVLLSGLCLNTPSEISHFKKIHEQLELPCCITAAITASPLIQPDISKGCGIQNNIRFLIQRQTELLGRSFG